MHTELVEIFIQAWKALEYSSPARIKLIFRRAELNLGACFSRLEGLIFSVLAEP